MTYSLPDKRKLLSNTIFFTEMPDSELDSILVLSIERYFKNGQVVFQKGDAGDSLLAVLNGKVRISTGSDEGREIILNTICRGEMFGEIALIDGLERSATATAVGECTLLIIKRSDFLPFLEKNPKIAVHWLKLLCKKLRDTSDRVATIGFLPVPVSLARLLIKAADEMGEKKPDGVYINWKKSQQEIGNEIGTSRESINKQLNKWKKKGLLALGGQSLSVTIIDLKALDDIAKGFI
jgi:CRP-like cAMP-binding protein